MDIESQSNSSIIESKDSHNKGEQESTSCLKHSITNTLNSFNLESFVKKYKNKTKKQREKFSVRKYLAKNNYTHSNRTNNIVDENSKRYIPKTKTKIKTCFINSYFSNNDKFQTKLLCSNILLIGAGGIGCELIKILIATNIKKITIVDMDTIEKSNLNRQFLFNEQSVGQFKSSIVKKRVLELKPDFKLEIDSYVGNIKDTSLFNVEFFNKFDFIINALDNVDARLYVSNIAFYLKKPLINGGSEGLLGYVGVYNSNIKDTSCYGCVRKEKKEKVIPICSIKSRPEKIEHCVAWAKNLLEQIFCGLGEVNILDDYGENNNNDNKEENKVQQNKNKADFNMVIEKKDNFLKLPYSNKASTDNKKIEIRKEKNYEVKNFIDILQSLLYKEILIAINNEKMNIIKNQKNKNNNYNNTEEYEEKDDLIKHNNSKNGVENNNQFLRNIKTIDLSSNIIKNTTNINFIVDCIHWYIDNFYNNNKRNKDEGTCSNIIDFSITKSLLSNEEKVKIAIASFYLLLYGYTNDSLDNNANNNEDGKLRDIISQIKLNNGIFCSYSNKGNANNNENTERSNIEFKKYQSYDKNNKHMIYLLYSLANLRAFNFNIPESSRFDIEQIAGKIIPAIATTNSIIAAIEVIELIKLINSGIVKDKNSNIKNSFLSKDRRITSSNAYSDPPEESCATCNGRNIECLIKCESSYNLREVLLIVFESINVRTVDVDVFYGKKMLFSGIDIDDDEDSNNNDNNKDESRVLNTMILIKAHLDKVSFLNTTIEDLLSGKNNIENNITSLNSNKISIFYDDKIYLLNFVFTPSVDTSKTKTKGKIIFSKFPITVHSSKIKKIKKTNKNFQNKLSDLFSSKSSQSNINNSSFHSNYSNESLINSNLLDNFINKINNSIKYSIENKLSTERSNRNISIKDNNCILIKKKVLKRKGKNKSIVADKALSNITINKGYAYKLLMPTLLGKKRSNREIVNMLDNDDYYEKENSEEERENDHKYCRLKMNSENEYYDRNSFLSKEYDKELSDCKSNCSNQSKQSRLRNTEEMNNISYKQFREIRKIEDYHKRKYYPNFIDKFFNKNDDETSRLSDNSNNINNINDNANNIDYSNNSSNNNIENNINNTYKENNLKSADFEIIIDGLKYHKDSEEKLEQKDDKKSVDESEKKEPKNIVTKRKLK